MTSSEENENKKYKGKDPMSPEEITSHEPTAVKEIQRIKKLQKEEKQVLIQKKQKKNTEKKV